MLGTKRANRSRAAGCLLVLSVAFGAVGCGGGAGASADISPVGGDAAGDGVGADAAVVADVAVAPDAAAADVVDTLDVAVPDTAALDAEGPEVGDAGPPDGADGADVFEDVAGEDAGVEDVGVEDVGGEDIGGEDIGGEDTAADAGTDVGTDAAGDAAEPCADECTADARQCASGAATRTCGQYDADDCLEWSDPAPCAAGSSCAAGTCVPDQPAALLVNEVLYDAPGGDGSAGTTVFIELWGPPAMALDGYRVVAVNGNGGGEYETIALDGLAIGADGFFVIAHPSAAEDLRAVADLLDAGVDLQNGPDSVQVRWGATVLDALGYGDFGTGDVFAGEGQPAAATGVGESLSRAPDHGDSDDNAADFTVGASSPGAAGVGCADECATAGITACDGSGGYVTCGAGFDGDGCLEWGPKVDCPAGETCSDDACAPPPCDDECPQDGAQQCVAAVVRTCGAGFDADECLEWGGETPCALGLECDAAGADCRVPALHNYEWNVHAGAGQNDWAMAVDVDAEGAALVTGIFTGPFTLGTEALTYGNTDIFLTKVSATGDVVWARDIGGGAVDQVADLALAPNGDAVFTGWYDGTTTIGDTTLSNANSSWDAFLARYTADGAPVWAMKFAGDGDNEGLGVAVGATGDLYVCGVYEEWFALSSVYGLSGNAFLAKLDGDGDVTWSFGVGGPQYDGASAVAVDADGNVFITGSVGSLVDFDPGAEEHEGGPGLFVAKYGPDGSYRWHFVKRNGHGRAIAVDARGDAYVTGVLTASSNLGGGDHVFQGGTSDGFLLKVSGNGAYMWSSHLGSIGPDALRDVDVDPVGNVLVTGDFGGPTTWEGTGLAYAAIPGSANEDVVLAEFTPDGAMNWAVRFGGPGQEWGEAVAAARTGDVVWAGHFSGTVALNDDILESQGYGDLVVARFAGTSDGSPGCFAAAPVCAEHGSCREVGDTPLCACDPGWAGMDCAACATGYEVRGGACVSRCEDVSCGATERCDASSGTAVCVCAVGYAGAGCATCDVDYVEPAGCVGDACVCVPRCGPGAPAGACADCAGAVELRPGVGSLEGFLPQDGADAVGGCGGYGPDHALTFTLDEPTFVELSLVTTYPVLYLRRICDDPETQIACDASAASSIASIAELLDPGSYTLWLDTQDGTGSLYTLHYSFQPAP